MEKNKLIADFMGLKFAEDGTYTEHDGEQKPVAYATSWEWLMPVVEKIESITGTCFEISYCVSFAWWYSKKKTKFMWREPRMSYFDSIGGKFFMKNCYWRVAKGHKFKKEEVEKTRLLATYNVCCQFIEWYNKRR